MTVTQMPVKSWTVAQMKDDEQCCYSRARVAELWAGREALTLRDILALDIPAEDRLWVAGRPGALTEAQYSAWRIVFLTRCITKYALTCGVPRVELWAQRWLSGEDRSRDASAYAAAAAYAAYADAADATAAYAAAATAAYAAAADATAAYADAAYADARTAERQQQLDDLITILSVEE